MAYGGPVPGCVLRHPDDLRWGLVDPLTLGEVVQLEHVPFAVDPHDALQPPASRWPRKMKVSHAAVAASGSIFFLKVQLAKSFRFQPII